MYVYLLLLTLADFSECMCYPILEKQKLKPDN